MIAGWFSPALRARRAVDRFLEDPLVLAAAEFEVPWERRERFFRARLGPIGPRAAGELASFAARADSPLDRWRERAAAWLAPRATVNQGLPTTRGFRRRTLSLAALDALGVGGPEVRSAVLVAVERAGQPGRGFGRRTTGLIALTRMGERTERFAAELRRSMRDGEDAGAAAVCLLSIREGDTNALAFLNRLAATARPKPYGVFSGVQEVAEAALEIGKPARETLPFLEAWFAELYERNLPQHYQSAAKLAKAVAAVGGSPERALQLLDRLRWLAGAAGRSDAEESQTALLASAMELAEAHDFASAARQAVEKAAPLNLALAQRREEALERLRHLTGDEGH